MGRVARVVIPGYPHHITQRGNSNQRTFFRDEDFRYYIKLLSLYAKKAGTEVWAYCLMPNHVHFVMVPSRMDGLRAVLGEAHRHYTRYINFREGWRGHLWQERYHSFIMDERYLLAAVRYVERNPVMAGFCACPHQWAWSSARAHMKGENDGLATVAPMLDRVDNWYAYLSDNCEYYRERGILELHSRTGRPLGGHSFIRKLEALSGKRLMPHKPGPKPTPKKETGILSPE